MSQGARVVLVTTIPETLPFMRVQVERLRQEGFDVHCVSSSGEWLERFAKTTGVAVHAVEMERKITPIQDLRSLWELTNLLRKLGPELVHASTPKGGLLGTTAAFFARVPNRIYHMRGLPMDTARGAKYALLWSTEKVSCGLAHRVIAVGNSIRNKAIAAHLATSDKIVILAGGSGQGVDATGKFDPKRFSAADRAARRRELGIPDNGLVVGFVGRIVKDKEVPELAEAWKNLRDKHPSAYLLLVGPEESKDAIAEDTQQRLRGDERVRMTGLVPDPAAFMSIMDLLVLPTHREGFPNVPLEAAAMELPVVASNIEPCREAVLDGTTGTLFPVGDAKSLESAIEPYLSSGELRTTHGQSGRRRVLTEFSSAASAEALVQQYRELLGRKTKRRVLGALA